MQLKENLLLYVKVSFLFIVIIILAWCILMKLSPDGLTERNRYYRNSSEQQDENYPNYHQWNEDEFPKSTK